MKRMKYAIGMTALALTLAGSSMLGLQVAEAHDAGSFTSLKQKLVDRFHLNEGEVQAVFDEVRDQHQAERKVHLDERLTEAVTSGDLTEEQKQLILAKQEELQAQWESNRAALESMTKAERREAMKEHRDDLTQWAADNGIQPQYIFGGRGPGMHDDFRK